MLRNEAQLRRQVISFVYFAIFHKCHFYFCTQKIEKKTINKEERTTSLNIMYITLNNITNTQCGNTGVTNIKIKRQTDGHPKPS